MVIAIMLALSALSRRQRTHRERVQSFWEDECRQMTSSEFKAHFRLERSTFELVLAKIQDEFPPQQPTGRPRVRTDKQLAIFLWRLAEGQESLRSLGLRFNVGKVTAWKCVIRTAHIVCRVLGQTYIHLPQAEEEWELCRQNFETLSQGCFPACVGAMDGVHVPILGPSADYDARNSYINR